MNVGIQIYVQLREYDGLGQDSHVWGALLLAHARNIDASFFHGLSSESEPSPKSGEVTSLEGIAHNHWVSCVLLCLCCESWRSRKSLTVG